MIVGSNGTGKSTILKLLVHIYDVDEGVVLIDGRDIRSLKLADLRQTMAVLFQDYNHFPLTVRYTCFMLHALSLTLKRDCPDPRKYCSW